MRRTWEVEAILDSLAFAKGEVQLPRFVPGQPQTAAERRAAHHADELNAQAQHQRRMAGGPQRAHRLRDALRIGMIHTLIPTAGSLWKVGVVAHRVQRGLHETVLPWLRVLRHEEHVAAPLVAYLMHELVKGGRVG